MASAVLDRSVKTHHGDCNLWIPQILSEIKPKEATFCLLDQRMFECHWSTVETVAQHKENKIEIFYFLAAGWWRRSITALQDDEKLRLWWGGEDLETVRRLTPEALMRAFMGKFQDLGYCSVMPWPIFEGEGEGRVMYYMIHATDHPKHRY